MIGKATRGASFGGLAAYLTGKPERVAWTEPRYLLGTDPKEIAREMEAAAGLSSRVEKPVYHLSISFDELDRPTREQMRAAVEEVLKDLGLEEHQAFLVAHRDAAHPHVHVMVNRVHPETGKAAPMSHDYAQIERSLRRLGAAWGMQKVAGHHAREAGMEAPDRSQSRTTGEVRQERRTGAISFPDEVREKAGKDLLEARSWSELTAALERHGLRVEVRGRGMVITDGERVAKASRVMAEASGPCLARRFGQTLGDYLAGDRSAVPHRGGAPSASGQERTSGDAPGGPSAGTPKTPQHGRSGAGSVYGLVQAVRGLERLREEPEREVPRRVLEGALSAAQAMVHRNPVLKNVYEAVRAYEHARTKEAALGEALGGYAAAEAKLKGAAELEDHANRLSKFFDQELARTFRDARAARHVFIEMAEQRGPSVAAETLRRQAEHLGPVIVGEKKKWLGLRAEASKAPAYRAAISAADVGKRYLQARERIPSERERTAWRAALERDQSTVERLSGELKGKPGSERLLARAGEHLAKLTPQQKGRLQQVIAPRSFSAVARAARAVGKSLGR